MSKGQVKVSALRRAHILSVFHREGVNIKAGMLTPYRKKAAQAIRVYNKPQTVKRASLEAFLKTALTTQGTAQILKTASDRARTARVLTAVHRAVRRYEG